MEQADILPRIRKLRGIVQHQQGASYRRRSFARCAKMPRQDLHLNHALVREEPIRGLRIRPVLTRQRNTLSGPSGQLLQHHAEPLA